ncbi:MAG: prolyl oligopeptidase family serine peptidase [Planctomycetales bacterium]|nr:prolyl oligopeptidase family serine peptidase [Planctomycetales bacterium]
MQAAEFTTTVQQKVTLKYWIYLPADYDKQEKWPLMIFLHGAGERGDDLDQVKRHGPPAQIAQGKSLPMIVVSPQCPANTWWQPEAVAKLTQDIISKHKVDTSRVYLTGLSMGGFGTWATTIQNPGLYAAAVPICGGGEPGNVAAIKDLPIWVFHGAKDSVVPLARSQEMVDALRAAGGNVKFTIYPEAEHDSWTETYNNPEVYEWILQQKR